MTNRTLRLIPKISLIRSLVRIAQFIILVIIIFILGCLFIHLFFNDSKLVSPTKGSALNRVVTLWHYLTIGKDNQPIVAKEQSSPPRANSGAASNGGVNKNKGKRGETPKLITPEIGAASIAIPTPSTSEIDSSSTQTPNNGMSSAAIDWREAFTFNDLLTQSNNLLVYFSILVIFITLLVGVASVKLLGAFRKMEHAQEIAETAVLDSALTTVAAVPLIEPSQQTSDTYFDAIETITETVDSLRKLVCSQSRYAALLVVEGLRYWKDGDLENCRESLKEAHRLAQDKSLREIVAFHFARCFKQLSFDAAERSERCNFYIKEAAYWANHTSSEMKYVIRLSLAQQRFIRNPDNIISRDILISLIKEILDSPLDLKAYIQSSFLLDDPHDLAQYTALVVLAIDSSPSIDPTIDLADRKRIAGFVLKYFERNIHGQIASNRSAASYLTMARLASILSDDPQYDLKKGEYLLAARECMKIAENKGVASFFVYYSLAEESPKMFRQAIEEVRGLHPGA